MLIKNDLFDLIDFLCHNVVDSSKYAEDNVKCHGNCCSKKVLLSTHRFTAFYSRTEKDFGNINYLIQY